MKVRDTYAKRCNKSKLSSPGLNCHTRDAFRAHPIPNEFPILKTIVEELFDTSLANKNPHLDQLLSVFHFLTH